MQKNKLTLLRRELAHVRSSGRLFFLGRQPVTSQALPARLHGLCSITRQIRRFLGAPASRQLASCNANCLQSPKALHTHKNIPFPMQRNLSNQQKRVVFMS